jgi:hypothetical protein
MLLWMRTTVRLSEQLLAEVKQHAARTGRTLTAVIEDALRLALAEGQRSKAVGEAKLPTFRGDGLQPGADLDDTAALTDLMDQTR